MSEAQQQHSTSDKSPDNLVLLHPASTFRSLTPLATYSLGMSALSARCIGQQMERNARLFGDFLTCSDVSKATHLNQSWLADTQRMMTMWYSEVKELKEALLIELAERVSQKR